jgi:hypothetical protein
VIGLKDCTKPVKSAAYTAIVRSIVEYASTVWDHSNQKKIKSIEQVQKRAARFVHNYTDRSPGCVTNMVKYNLQLKLCTLYVIHFLPVLDFRAALNPSIVSADVVLAGS